MPAIRVRIPAALRAQTNGDTEVEVDAANVKDVVGALEARYPGLGERLLDERGDLRRFINIYVNGEDVRFLDGMATPIKQGDELSIIPAVAGG